MNRRFFLTSMAAAFVLDPERALWRPGAKLISIPKPAGVFVTPEMLKHYPYTHAAVRTVAEALEELCLYGGFTWRMDPERQLILTRSTSS